MTGQELREIRKSRGMNQIEFSKLINRHSQTVSDYERGKKPIPKTIEKLFQLGL